VWVAADVAGYSRLEWIEGTCPGAEGTDRLKTNAVGPGNLCMSTRHTSTCESGPYRGLPGQEPLLVLVISAGVLRSFRSISAQLA
jgi:hypothetical protein